MGKRKDYTPELKDIAVYAERGSFSYVTYSSTYYVVVHRATGIEVNGRRELRVEHAQDIAKRAQRWIELKDPDAYIVQELQRRGLLV